jgi:hypothetical protein
MPDERSLSRRSLLRDSAIAAGVLRGNPNASAAVVDSHAKGGFRFLRGIAPYSSGAIAERGHEVVHVTFAVPPPYRLGFVAMDRHLKQEKRPAQSLCGIELRSPRPFSFDGFNQFNQEYIEQLKQRGLLVNDVNPVARTNVAPEVRPPSEVLLYGFSYTAPARITKQTFVIAGAGELSGDRLDARDIVSRGDVSPAGLRAKASHVLAIMDQRLRALGVSWKDVTIVDVYAAHNITPLMKDLLLVRAGAAAIHGMHWHFARPPIQEIEFEMDVRGCARELVL